MNNYGVQHLLHYLDDFLTARPPELKQLQFHVAALRPDSGSCKVVQD